MDNVIVSVNIVKGKINLIDYFTDFKSNIFGPEDFAVDEDKVYILNSTDNTVLEFVGGKYMCKHDVGYAAGIKITAGSGFLYIMRNDFSLMRISKDSTDFMQLENVTTEAIADFTAIGKNLYMVIADGKGGITYRFEFSPGTFDIMKAEKLNGRIFDENTLYEVEMFSNCTTGMQSEGKITVSDINGKKISEIPVHTEYCLVGAQYFGNDTDGSTYVKIYELRTDNNYTPVVETSLCKLDSTYKIKYIRSLSRQYKYIVDQERVINGNLYALNNFEAEVQVVMLSKPDEKSTQEYSSVLKNIIPPTVQPMPTSEAKITRQKTMENAASFHYEFAWSCTEANLMPMKGWEPPSYVKGAGSYRYMPYCWGGNSTAQEFIAGLASGGHVGNIDSPGPALVPNTYGHDCSGFVGLCWGETQKYSTYTIKDISEPISAEDIKQGDALNRPYYHIALFDAADKWGNYILYESTVLNNYDRVAHTLRPILSMSEYKPIKYINMIDEQPSV